MSTVLNEERVRSNWVPPGVDDLVPIKPIKKYEEFRTSSLYSAVNGFPDYIFQLKNLSSLIQDETELMGKEFPLPNLNFTAQIKCDVKYDTFQLYIRFLDPDRSGQPMDTRIQPVRMITVIKKPEELRIKNQELRIKNQELRIKNSEEQLVHVFPFDSQLIYGTFVPFSTLSYDKNLKDAIYDRYESSVTLHLRARVTTKDVFLDDGVLRWKVYLPLGQLKSSIGPNQVKELGLSPFVHVHPDGMRVQIRLYVQSNNNCSVQVRVMSERDCCKVSVIDLRVIHPTDPTRPFLTSSFDFKNVKMERVCSKVFAVKSELEKYVSDENLLVKVEIR